MGFTLNIYVGFSYKIFMINYENMYLKSIDNVIKGYNQSYYNKIIIEDYSHNNMNNSIYLN